MRRDPLGTADRIRASPSVRVSVCTDSSLSAHDLAGTFGEPESDRPLSALLREDRERERAEDEARVERLREEADGDGP